MEKLARTQTRFGESLRDRYLEVLKAGGHDYTSATKILVHQIAIEGRVPFDAVTVSKEECAAGKVMSAKVAADEWERCQAILDELGMSFAHVNRMMAVATIKAGVIPFYPGIPGARHHHFRRQQQG